MRRAPLPCRLAHCVRLTGVHGAEMLDRTSITLPAAQTMMLKRVIDDCQAAGKPVVVVLVNGAGRQQQHPSPSTLLTISPRCTQGDQ